MGEREGVLHPFGGRYHRHSDTERSPFGLRRCHLYWWSQGAPSTARCSFHLGLGGYFCLMSPIYFRNPFILCESPTGFEGSASAWGCVQGPPS